jgi:hypothetical protein
MTLQMRWSLGAENWHLMLKSVPLLARSSFRSRTRSATDGPRRLGGCLRSDWRTYLDGSLAYYLSIECNCDWEVEPGMQLVLRDGWTVSKVSPYDGHLTNADAFANPKLRGVVYVRMPSPRPLPCVVREGPNVTRALPFGRFSRALSVDLTLTRRS